MLGVADFRRLGRSAARLASTRYPAFLFGADVPSGEIPVFTYHDIDTRTLEEDLEFLERNGYRTLSLDEFHDRMRGASGARDRVVLLTFDDARRSFWEVAYPVLKARQARAALFVPTYWVGEEATGEEGTSANGAERPMSVPPGFMTWRQLEQCRRSGLIDVESHAHRHTLIAAGPRLAAFATPAALAHYDLFDWPMRREDGGDVCGRPPLGTPIYESTPLLSSSMRFIEPLQATAACRGLVESGGGAAFFDRPSALQELRAAHRAALARAHGGRETIEMLDVGVEIGREIALAVEAFERHLGYTPRYFAYPWRLGSAASARVLAEHGFVAAFGVALDFRRLRRTTWPLSVYGRYKCDWLRFLPGEGRRRLTDVVPQKVATFLKAQHLAH